MYLLLPCTCHDPFKVTIIGSIQNYPRSDADAIPHLEITHHAGVAHLEVAVATAVVVVVVVVVEGRGRSGTMME
jgi:hypothetical protein